MTFPLGCTKGNDDLSLFSDVYFHSTMFLPCKLLFINTFEKISLSIHEIIELKEGESQGVCVAGLWVEEYPATIR